MAGRLFLRSPVAAAGLVVAAVGLGVVGLRALGALESLELTGYDWYVRLQPVEPAPDPRVVLITATERDIHTRGGWPLSDHDLAGALATLVAAGPRAIGLDIYRDVPVWPGSDDLDRMLRTERRIVAVRQFGDGVTTGVAPPPALAQSPDQVGFNDVLVDPGGTVRRGLLYLEHDGESISSLGLQLAHLYLAGSGVSESDDRGRLRLGPTTIAPLESDDGPYVDADARGYQFLLDFKGGRSAFASFSLSELAAGHVPRDAVRDKVVLIGVTAESVQDHFYTPYSRGLRAGQQVAGLVIHAHTVSQLLRMALDGAAPLRTLGKRLDAVWILLWSAIGGLVALGLRSPWQFSAASAAALAALGLIDYGAFVRGLWLPLVPPAIVTVVSAALVTAYAAYQETIKRAVLMQLFSRHVSREVAEAIWADRELFLEGRRPRPQRLMATVLFTDLARFSGLAERLPPEALMEWLNEYMEAMAREAIRFGGVIRQYAGDSIVVIFGVPVARRTEEEISRDAVNAVECALAMEATLLERNRRWQAAGRPTTGMRIGVFTGPVVAGSLGGAERSEYAVVGDTVNIASRLESFDKDLHPPDPEKRPGRILIGETTLRYLGQRFETERVGDVSLKGRSLPVGVYRVVGRADVGSKESTAG